MQTTFWLVLLCVFIAGYLALEGADFGAGMVLPILGRRDEAGRDRVVRAIAPAFLGNEVWLVATIGIAEGAFPKLDGPLLSRLYPVFIVILIAWLVRDAGLWFRRQGTQTWRWRWDWAIAVASGLIAAGWGVATADIALGLPAQPFGPIPVLCGVVLAGFCVLHATALLGTKLPVGIISRVRGALTMPVTGGIVVAGAFIALTGAPGQHWPLWLLGGLLLTATLTTAWPITTVTMAALMPLAALTAFPYLPTGLTAEAASNPATLSTLTPIVIAVLPVLLAAQVGLWLLNRRPTKTESYF